jgi:hypothetical protein
MAVENWASIRGRRVRVVAELSCPVCDGSRVMGLVAVANLTIPTPCWHCSLGEASIPLFPQNLNTSRSA